MARALEIDPINQLQENLQCSVCLEALKDPRTLPCFHSFCKDCLEGVVKTCRDEAPRDRRPIQEFPCPDCRTMFTLEPEKHVADMPRNHFICNMVQVTAVLDRGTRIPCSHNCSQSSVARCVTCEKFLCRECLTGHNNYRANDGHSVLTMEELSKPENRSKINGTMYCNEHSGMPLKVYCETCDKLICTDCMLFKHVKPNHSCFLVKDVASYYRELLASNNTAMENALTEGNDFLQQLSLTTAQLYSDAKNAKSEIAERKDGMAKKIVDMLDQKASSLISRVDEINEDKRKKLDEQTKETKSYVENIKQSVQLSKKLVEQGTEEEIISSQKIMLENANNLLRRRSEYFKATIPVTKVRYIPDTSKEPLDDDNVRAIENSLGNIIEGNEDIGSNQAENKLGQRNKSLGFSSTTFVQPAGSSTSAIDQSAKSKRPDETFPVTSLFLRYILAYHYEVFEKLESVSKEIGFEEKTKCEKDLKITARENVDKKVFLKTVDDFIDFYQREHQKMHQEVVPLRSAQVKMDVISEARLKFSVVIDSTTESDKLTIYGEKDKVLEAKGFLRSKVGGFHSGNASGSSKPKPRTTGKKILVEKLSCVLFKNIKVSVYQGDITKETVDVIVNPANQNLKHSAGVAEAIVKAGGKSIQDESNDIMKKRRYNLSPGEATATKAGKLPCKFIIHAVGPRWANYQYFQKDAAKNALYCAVMNCLTVANYNSATSISMPAISSGIFGVPVPICAEVLFTAVARFAENAPTSNSLKDIRFVNFDKQTTQAFAKEMHKQFGASVKQEIVEVFHSNNEEENGKSGSQKQSC